MVTNLPPHIPISMFVVSNRVSVSRVLSNVSFQSGRKVDRHIGDKLTPPSTNTSSRGNILAHELLGHLISGSSPDKAVRDFQ